MRLASRFLTCAGLSLAVAACTGAEVRTEARGPAQETVDVGMRCPINLDWEGIDLSAGPPPKVFVEMALFEVPADRARDLEKSSLEALAHDPDVRLRSITNALADHGEPSTVVRNRGPFGSAGLAGEEPMQLTVVPTVDLSANVKLQIDLALDARGDQGAAEPRWSARKVVITQDQASALVAVPPTPGQSATALVAVVTPYIVRGPTALQRLFECKMAARGRRTSGT